MCECAWTEVSAVGCDFRGIPPASNLPSLTHLELFFRHFGNTVPKGAKVPPQDLPANPVTASTQSSVNGNSNPVITEEAPSEGDTAMMEFSQASASSVGDEAGDGDAKEEGELKET